MKIAIYSTGCPKCTILKKKLMQNDINFEEINDIDIMLNKGITQAPMLEIDGNIMDFKNAVEWINNKN